VAQQLPQGVTLISQLFGPPSIDEVEICKALLTRGTVILDPRKLILFHATKLED
jgi:hypothetical protein